MKRATGEEGLCKLPLMCRRSRSWHQGLCTSDLGAARAEGAYRVRHTNRRPPGVFVIQRFRPSANSWEAIVQCGTHPEYFRTYRTA